MKIFKSNCLSNLQSVSHIMAVNGTHGFESKKKYADKSKLNSAARDDTLRS